MGILKDIAKGLGLASEPKKGRKKNLKKPKANATKKQLESYVKKRSKQLKDKVEKEELKQAAEMLYNATPESLMKKKR